MPDAIDRLQTALANRYRIEQEAGRGGMATVYLAEDLKHKRQVAIKVLRPDLAQAIGGDRFLREIEIAARLQHPHILPLYDSGDADGLLYYVMPYVQGESLRDRIAREGELPVADTIKILRDVADALAEAHEQGVVHRDVKPDNVLFKGQHAVVTDFGVAKAVSEAAESSQLTTAGVALGTPAYMAPEQATADPNTDHRADIYALGVLGYEMLTGELPFTGSSAQAVLAAQITEQPRPVAARRTAVPDALALLVMRCLEKKPADRWQSAAELRRTLDTMATPSGGTMPLAAVAQTGSRTPWIAGAVVVAALAAGAGWMALRDEASIPLAAANTMVTPFVPTVPDSALATLGRNLVVTLSANLDGVGDITVVDPLSILSATEHGAAPNLEGAAALAAERGATSFIHGTMIASGSNVRLDAGMYVTDDRHVLARVTVNGSRDNLSALTDSLTWAVLRGIWRGDAAAPTPSIEAVTTGSMEALKVFIEGEELASRHDFLAAAGAYARAIAADSSFWLAYWRNARALEWYGQPVDSVVQEAYREHRFDLPERERLLIEVRMASPHIGEQLEMLEEVLRRYPGYWPAWMDYADLLTHQGGLVGRSAEERDVALRRVIELNPQFAAAWSHLAGGNWRRNPLLADSANQRQMPLIFRDSSIPEVVRSGIAWQGRWLQDVARDGYPADSLVDEILASMAEAGRPPTGWVLAVTFSDLPGLPAAARLAEGFPSDPLHLALMARVNAQRGAWDSALVLLHRQTDMGPESGPGGASRFAFSDAEPVDAYATVAALAWLGAISTDAAQEFRGRASASVASSGDTARVTWSDALLAVAQSDTAALAQALALLPGTGDGDNDDVARSLAAFAAWLDGDQAAAADSLAALEWERAEAGRWRSDGFAIVTVVNRMAASRWLLAAGDADQALRLSHWVEMSTYTEIDFLGALVKSLVRLEQGRLAEQLGDRDRARFYYGTFLDMYDLPMERHRYLVEEAEAAMVRLADETQ